LPRLYRTVRLSQDRTCASPCHCRCHRSPHKSNSECVATLADYLYAPSASGGSHFGWLWAPNTNTAVENLPAGLDTSIGVHKSSNSSFLWRLFATGIECTGKSQPHADRRLQRSLEKMNGLSCASMEIKKAPVRLKSRAMRRPKPAGCRHLTGAETELSCFSVRIQIAVFSLLP
jgi:hypothetical protein